ncbi:MAG: hypothetical protein RR204_00545 [Raoultibacter sp.]
MQDNNTHTNLKTKLHAAKAAVIEWPRKRQIVTGCASAAIALCLIGGGTALALNMPGTGADQPQAEQNAQKSTQAKTDKKTTDSKAAGDEKTKASDTDTAKTEAKAADAATTPADANAPQTATNTPQNGPADSNSGGNGGGNNAPSPAPSPEPPAHVHSFSIPQVTLVHHPATTQEVAIYGTLCVCGEIEPTWEHTAHHLDNHEPNRTYGGIIGYETKPLYHAWDEEVITGYACSCGAIG